jgi:hypothetical protein
MISCGGKYSEPNALEGSHDIRHCHAGKVQVDKACSDSLDRHCIGNWMRRRKSEKVSTEFNVEVVVVSRQTETDHTFVTSMKQIILSLFIGNL